MLGESFNSAIATALDFLFPCLNHLRTVGATTFSKNGRLAATAGQDGCVKVIDVDSQKRIWRFRDRKSFFLAASFINEDRTLCCLAFSGKAYCFDVCSGRIEREFSLPKITSCRFLSDGRRALLGGYRFLALWNLEENTEITRFNGHQDGQVHTIALSADETRFISGTALAKSVYYWNIISAEPVREFTFNKSVCSATLDPQCNWFAVAEGFGDRIRRYALPEGEDLGIVADVRDDAFRVFVFPGGKHMLVAYHSGGLGLVEIASLKEMYRTDQPLEAACVLAISPDGRWVLAGGVHGEVAFVRMSY